MAPGATATACSSTAATPRPIARVGGYEPAWPRLGRPDDIAEVVSFLAGAARWINGQTIYVNGGAV